MQKATHRFSNVNISPLNTALLLQVTHPAFAERWTQFSSANPEQGVGKYRTQARNKEPALHVFLLKLLCIYYFHQARVKKQKRDPECIQWSPSPASFINYTHQQLFFGEKYSKHLAKEKIVYCCKDNPKAIYLLSERSFIWKYWSFMKEWKTWGKKTRSTPPQLSRRCSSLQEQTLRAGKFRTHTKHWQWRSIFIDFINYEETSKQT